MVEQEKNKDMNTRDLEQITSKVAAVARKAGAFIKKERLSFDLSKIEYKGARDLVSYVDKESEKQVVAALREILPGAGFITEEGTVGREDKEYQWVIDPLDGTTNFLHALPTFSVSIGLMRGGEVLCGVIYEPNLDECFYAWKDGGAYCNGRSIHVSPIAELDRSLVATGFPYSLLNKESAYLQILQQFVRTTHGLRRLGSAAIDLAYVACGRFEGFYEFNLKIWDISAGIVLVKEAGGTVSDFSGGNDYLYGKEMLAAGGLHPEMLKVIREFW